MPKQKVFEMRAINTETWTEFVKESVNDWKKYIYSVVEQVERVESEIVKELCYFSIMESIAQDLSNYDIDKNQKDIFTEFVLKYQDKYSFLELVDPVTLYYRKEEKLSSIVSLVNIIDGGVYAPKDHVIRNTADNIEIAVKKLFEDKYAKRLLKDHRYVDLLYRLRCRASHEFSQSGISKNENHSEPYYISCYRVYVKDENIVEDNVWKLNIPSKFLKDLCLNCVDNYLEECLKTNSLPVANDGMGRLCELSWYNR